VFIQSRAVTYRREPIEISEVLGDHTATHCCKMFLYKVSVDPSAMESCISV